MANTDRNPSASLSDTLIEEGRRFSFIQAYRLLQHLIGQQSSEQKACNSGSRIRVRPELSLTFPESDIVDIEKDSDDTYRMTVSFLGLYGASSPLPTFYTEDLFAEQLADSSAARDFLDILNAPLYDLYFRIWAACHLHYQIIESGDHSALERMYCLLGLPEQLFRDRIPGHDALIRYIGVISQSPRSAEGLRAFLADIVPDTTITVVQCIPRTVTLPEDQRFSLGIANNRLGSDGYLGHELIDRMGTFRIEIGPVGSSELSRLLPGQPAFTEIDNRIRFYVDQPLEWEICILVDNRKIKPARPGDLQWGQIGYNTWGFSGDPPQGIERIIFQSGFQNN